MKNKYVFTAVLLAVILFVGNMLTMAYVRTEQSREQLKEGNLLVVTSFYPMYVAAENVIGDVEGVTLENLSEPQTGCLHDYQLTALDLICLCSNNNRMKALIYHPLVHYFVVRRWLMADIHQQKYCPQLFGTIQIILDHSSPFFFFLLRYFCKTIPRKIRQVQFIVDIIKIDGLCLARLTGSAGKCLAVHQGVDQR